MSSFYLYHIRKTGGRSIIHVFLQSIIYTDIRDERGFHPLYEEVCKNVAIEIDEDEGGKKIVACHNIPFLRTNDYYFGFSHFAMHELRFPKDKNVTTITCLRDPIKRFLSYYRMLLGYHRRGDDRFSQTEGRNIDAPFRTFLKRVDRKHLLATIYMFSPRYSVDEAFYNITKHVDYVIFTETLDRDISTLPTSKDLSQFSEHVGSSEIKKDDIKLSEKDMLFLEDQLRPEIELYDRIREWAKNKKVL